MQILQPEQESRQKEALDIELKGNVHQEEIADIYARVLYNSKKIQGKKLFDYNIVLIGFMGAGGISFGKTAGRRTAGAGRRN